jgi:hypothetical protein
MQKAEKLRRAREEREQKVQTQTHIEERGQRKRGQ